jgi:hypothetical protein
MICVAGIVVHVFFLLYRLLLGMQNLKLISFLPKIICVAGIVVHVFFFLLYRSEYISVGFLSFFYMRFHLFSVVGKQKTEHIHDGWLMQNAKY